MPVWANTGTFTVTPSASFQNDGFDPTLPFPVEFLNWKLNELDMGGYFEHATGGSNTAATIRGGNSSAGAIVQAAVDTDVFTVSTYPSGTVETPSGTQTFVLRYSASANWIFDKHAQFTGATALEDAFHRRWGYGTSTPLVVEHHLADDATQWDDTPEVAINYVPTDSAASFNSIVLTIDNGTSNASVYVSLACLGSYNTEVATGLSNLKITGFTATGVSTDSTVSAEVSLVRKPRDGSAATILTNGGAVYTVSTGSSLVSLAGTQPAELVNLNNNAYFLRVKVTNTSGSTAQMSIRDIKLTLTKYAVE